MASMGAMGMPGLPGMQGGGGGQRPPGTASMRGAIPASRAGQPGLMSRMGQPGAVEENRPMTAVRAAGYTSAGPRPGTGALGGGTGASKGPAPPLQKRSENSPEDMCREMETEVNKLIEESALLASQKQYARALEQAKEAGKRERLLCKQREQNGLADQINIDLTYSVCFNLANQYHASGLYSDALNTYSLIVRNKQYAQSGRLRVNMGNIYYEQKKYPAAIKMYRMALDQIPNTGREVRYKIMRNIGNAFVRLGQFQDAIASYEQIMEGSADLQTGFNLVLCYYALGDKERQRRGFTRLLSVRHGDMQDEIDDSEQAPHDGGLHSCAGRALGGGRCCGDGALAKRCRDVPCGLRRAARRLTTVCTTRCASGRSSASGTSRSRRSYSRRPSRRTWSRGLTGCPRRCARATSRPSRPRWPSRRSATCPTRRSPARAE